MYKISGLILIFISFAISFNSYKKFETIHNGREVEVRVIDIPVSCKVSNRSLKPYFKFNYKGKEYSKNIKGKYCDILKKAKTIKLKTNSDNTIFIYKDEKMTMQYITITSLFVIGVLFLLKKNKT